MTAPAAKVALLDRFTLMGDLTANVCRMLKGAVPVLSGLLVATSAYLAFSDNPGAIAFGLISAGALIAFLVWANGGIGVPFLPMIVLQQFVIYALPIVNRHEVVAAYPMEQVTHAGLELFIFFCSLAGGWRMGMQVMTPASAESYALTGFEKRGLSGLLRLGFGLVAAATSFLILQSLDLTSFIFGLLPNGSYPIVGAAVAAASACGFFLLSMIMGSGEMSLIARVSFWLLMATNCLISASGLLLSAAAVVVASVIIGLFWSTGRLPWRFMVVMMVTISFFNTGKYTMRGRYWETVDQETRPSFGLTQLPSLYAEWTLAGFASLTDADDSDPGIFSHRQAAKRNDQSLLDRLNNLQNLLFVIEAMEDDKIPALNGRTYALIPPLLIPRVLWPDKPRTHEGQVLLNVHFGRQDLQSTFKTYIAWGLLPEAYGNFGPIKGAILLGLFLGLAFAWAENFTTRKPLLSAEGMVAFAIFLGLANSYEAVSTVMVTSVFQALVPVIAACSPFVRRMVVKRPAPE
jgi:hypothetical protein